jgi:hypothetical protein
MQNMQNMPHPQYLASIQEVLTGFQQFSGLLNNMNQGLQALVAQQINNPAGGGQNKECLAALNEVKNLQKGQERLERGITRSHNELKSEIRQSPNRTPPSNTLLDWVTLVLLVAVAIFLVITHILFVKDSRKKFF